MIILEKSYKVGELLCNIIHHLDCYWFIYINFIIIIYYLNHYYNL